MQCCQPHSNPSFSFFFSTLHRLSSSLNILKCLPLLLPASEKWWICNSDWLWRLVKNSLFLSHPPGKRVHFFPLTVACLPSDPSLFSKKISHNVKGTFISSPLLFFNPVLTIHLSVLLHVKIGVIVCACIFQGREGLICRQNNMLTSSTPHRTDVKTCGGVWLITPDSEKTPEIAVTRRKQGWMYSLWKLRLSVWIKPCLPGMSVRLRKCQKVHSDCIIILLPCWLCSTVQLWFKSKWFVVDLKPALMCLALTSSRSKAAQWAEWAARKGRQQSPTGVFYLCTAIVFWKHNRHDWI